jgi:YfiH family protein
MLRHPLLEACGVDHGFGRRDRAPPEDVLRPRQVHGSDIVSAAECRREPLPAADGVVSSEPGVAVGIVTADCVPVLLAGEAGGSVAAVHAGWRGLARGVVVQGVDALRQEVGQTRIVAAIGPHIGSCCYEVDAPVTDALSRALGGIDGAVRPSQPGHVWLDLAALVVDVLSRLGVAPADIGQVPGACTRCDALRFHSYRRDGARAGRLVHYVAAARA